MQFHNSLKDIMNVRLVCKQWTEAVKRTTITLPRWNEFGFKVQSPRSCLALEMLKTITPFLQQMSFWDLNHNVNADGRFTLANRTIEDNRHSYKNGTNSDPDFQRTYYEVNSNDSITFYDIGAISNFRKLRILQFKQTPLNGRYPFLFNFPCLKKLELDTVRMLEWGLALLSGVPLLEVLSVYGCEKLSGDLKSLVVLKDTLRELFLNSCANVRGNFMELASFPRLESVNLERTGVVGDVRYLRVQHFPGLKGNIDLPHGAFGGAALQRIDDAQAIIEALYPLKQRTPSVFQNKIWELSPDSPDWYESDIRTSYNVNPFKMEFVSAGPRVGWRWFATTGNSCEVNWLEAEPEKEYLISLTLEAPLETEDFLGEILSDKQSTQRFLDGYTLYNERMAKLDKEANVWRGFFAPPSEEEYIRWPGMPHL